MAGTGYLCTWNLSNSIKVYSQKIVLLLCVSDVPCR